LTRRWCDGGVFYSTDLLSELRRGKGRTNQGARLNLGALDVGRHA